MRTKLNHLFLLLICAAVTSAQTIVFDENFESYAADFNLTQAPAEFKVWEGVSAVVDVTGTENTAFEGVKYATSDVSKVNWQLRKPITLEVGKTYTLKIATKAQDGTKHFIQIIPKTAYETSWIETYNSDWKLHTTSFTVTAGNENVIISVYRYAKLTVGVDAISLTEGAPNNIATTKQDFLKVSQMNDGLMSIQNQEMMRSINIYSLNGDLIYSKTTINSTNHKVSLKNTSKGLYILSVTDNNGDIITKKISNC